MMGMSSLFSSYNVCSERDKIRIAYGSYSSIVGKCVVIASPSMYLSSIYHVPNFFLNLLSIRSLTRSLNCIFISEK